jgi:EH_Signature domain
LVLRDRGLILMLDKYVSTVQPGINEPLRNASVEWWGNPWLPSNETRWGGVVPAAREIVAEWLKREFIEAFFTKLAEDGVGDRRRANFWLRYVKSMGNIQFALGARALHSKDRDFEALRKKMNGLYIELKTTDSSNNAFIMTLGNLVAVEFGSMGNAFYGYDVRETLPFDASLPVGTAVNAFNSLKHKNRMLWMQHQDEIKGWNKWEDMFEATLKEHFDISPDAAVKRVTSRLAGTEPTSAPAPVPAPEQRSLLDGDKRDFSMADLNFYAGVHGIEVDDMRKLNGNLWVRTDDRDRPIRKTLLDWGFQYKPGKGWWR